MMPNMTVMAPKNKWELSDMLKFAIRQKSPVAIRYPRGEAYTGLEDYRAPIEMGKAEILEKGKEIAKKRLLKKYYSTQERALLNIIHAMNSVQQVLFKDYHKSKNKAGKFAQEIKIN